MENAHLLFEEWLLSDVKLAPEEVAHLEQHLETCTSCQRLSQAWREVETQMQRAPMLSPAPHFTQRWETRVIAERLRRERRQTSLILYLCAGSLFALLGWLGLWMFPTLLSPYPLLLVWVYQITASIHFIVNIGDLYITVVRAITGLLPGTVWIALSVALGSLTILWLITYKKLLSPRRVIS
jgi:hypothetical protein